MKIVFFFFFFLSVSLFASKGYDVNVQLKVQDNIIEKIQNIIDDNQNKKIKITVERGSYILSSPSHEKQLLKLHNVHHFSFDANGSIFFINKESVGLFSFKNSSDINISNMNVDYVSLPKVQGKVLSINKKNKELLLEVRKTDIASLKNNMYNKTKRKLYGLAFQKPGILKNGATAVNWITDIKHKKDQKYVIKYKKLHNVEINDIFVLVFRYPSPLFFMVNSHNLSFSNITVYASPSGVFVASRTSNAFFDNCNVLLKRGEYLSSNAGVFHFQSSRKGPKINGCTLEGVGDDIVSFYTKPMYLLKKLSQKSFLMSEKNFLIKINDAISFFDRKNGRIVFISSVSKIKKYRKDYIVTFSKNIPTSIDYNNLRLYNRETTAKGFEIKNSIFKNSRRYGCYIKAFDGKIVNNKFINLAGSAISIKNEPTWPEGLNSENVLIQNNKIINCGYGTNSKETCIEIKFLNEKGIFKYNENRNIRAINNTCVNSRMNYLQKYR